MNESIYIPPSEFFKRLKVDAGKLPSFGFVKTGIGWEYSEPVSPGSLVCHVTICENGTVRECVTDAATGDEYVQHRISGAAGKFVGKVRQNVMNLLGRIASDCFSRDVFKTKLAKNIVSFAESEWGESPQFLWRQFPDYAVLRRKDTEKWYALVARLPADKIGGNKNETVEIVNLRRTNGMDGAKFLPAYHMNKKTWAAIVLDDTMAIDELKSFLAASRQNAI